MALVPMLLTLRLPAFAQAGEPLGLGMDPTIERRWGAKISAPGSYRDPGGSSDRHFVKTSGLRWISRMWLTAIPWAERVWALPVMTGLSPWERYYQQRQRRPKTVLDRSLQILKALRRFLPEAELGVVGDNAFAALDFLAAAQQLKVTVFARLRLEAALYEPAPPYNKRGRPRANHAVVVRSLFLGNAAGSCSLYFRRCSLTTPGRLVSPPFPMPWLSSVLGSGTLIRLSEYRLLNPT